MPAIVTARFLSWGSISPAKKQCNTDRQSDRGICHVARDAAAPEYHTFSTTESGNLPQRIGFTRCTTPQRKSGKRSRRASIPRRSAALVG